MSMGQWPEPRSIRCGAAKHQAVGMGHEKCCLGSQPTGPGKIINILNGNQIGWGGFDGDVQRRTAPDLALRDQGETRVLRKIFRQPQWIFRAIIKDYRKILIA